MSTHNQAAETAVDTAIKASPPATTWLSTRCRSNNIC